jgi:SWI/SNF-related matrix-associated actin-dependent regulator 1 of chromatin subfamily A
MNRVSRPAPRRPRPKRPLNPYTFARGQGRLTFDAGRYVWIGSPDMRAFPRAAAFTYDAATQTWWTREPRQAATLRRFADALALEALGLVTESVEEVQASRATDADIEVPCPPGLSFYPYQKAGIAYALRRSGTLIADEMGLGKTAQAIGVINADETIQKVLVVCPASLKLNWQRELDRWLTRPLLACIVSDWFPLGAEIVILNYDVLHKWAAAIASVPWDLVILDEAHLVKNPQARRSRHALAIEGRRLLYLTGSPMVNRPEDVQPLVARLAPAVFGNRREYLRRFCTASPASFHGRQALNELQQLLRKTCMVRRLKRHVLSELPPKQRQVIEVTGSEDVVQEEIREAQAYVEAVTRARLRFELAKASYDDAEYEAAYAEWRRLGHMLFSQISRLRHLSALAKVPHVIEHLKGALEGGGKVVVFAHHHDVIDRLAVAFPRLAVKLTGEMNLRDRDGAVQRFMHDPGCRLFVGSIYAAGVGLTLTASSHVVFAELDWVPGVMNQAEDRCHRIGQPDSVLVQHVVLEGSLDARIAKTLVGKQRTIEQALDADKGELEWTPIVPLLEPPATENLTRAEVLRGEARVDVEAVRKALAALSGAVSAFDALMVAALRADELTPRQAVLARRLVRKYSPEAEPSEAASA